MGQRLLLALLAIFALLSPSQAFEVEEGACQRILTGQARVRIHYSSGVKAEVDPPDSDNITSQVDIFPDGSRLPQKWIGGGGLLPLESPKGRFTYADKEATRLRLELGERRHLAFTYQSVDRRPILTHHRHAKAPSPPALRFAARLQPWRCFVTT